MTEGKESKGKDERESPPKGAEIPEGNVEKPGWWRSLRRLVGIRRYPGYRLGVRLQTRFFVILAVLVVLALGAGLVRYSESPAFCNSCHIMEPYYNAWASSHHDFVPCVDCHYPPGSRKDVLWHKFQNLSQVAKYVTRTYSSKPFAQIDDGACLRSGCHSTRLLRGRVVSGKGIKFDHRPHLEEERRGRKLRCVSCHSQIVIGRHVEVTYDTCYLCHFKGYVNGSAGEPLGGCVGCHELPTETFRIGNISYNHRDFVGERGVSCRNCHLDVIRGEGHAPVDRCFTCHNNPDHLALYDDVPLLHEQHVTNRKVACFHCHQPLLHGIGGDEGRIMARLNEPTPPGPGERPASHPPSLSFDCSYCHSAQHSEQLLMYAGMGRQVGLPDMPSPMYLARVGCVGCHYEKDNGEGEPQWQAVISRASHGACVKCHGPGYEEMWDQTGEVLASTLARLAEKLDAARAALERAAPGEASTAREDLERAAMWHHFVRDARGEHNIYLAAVALRMEDELLESAGARLEVALPDLSEDDLISGGYCASMCHAAVGAEMPPEVVEYEEMGGEMPHSMHAEMISCARCHRIGAHKEVPLQDDLIEKVCSECH